MSQLLSSAAVVIGALSVNQTKLSLGSSSDPVIHVILGIRFQSGHFFSFFIFPFLGQNDTEINTFDVVFF